MLEIDAPHPDQAHQLPRGEHRIDIRHAVPPGFRTLRLEFLRRARHGRNAENPARIQLLELRETAFDQCAEHRLRALAAGKIRDELRIKLLDELDPARGTACEHRQGRSVFQARGQFRRRLHDGKIRGKGGVKHAPETETAQCRVQNAREIRSGTDAELLGK